MNLLILSLPKSYIFYFLYDCSIIKFYKRSVERALLKEKMVRIRRLILGFFAGIIVTYVIILSFYLVNSEAAFMLIVFDFLFVSLVFPLDGSFVKKIALLLIGNVIGLLWNSVFSSFSYVAACYFGESLNVLYIILNPLLNLIWVVSFWSISLSVLASSKTVKVNRLDS
jgi:hypothetical protein